MRTQLLMALRQIRLVIGRKAALGRREAVGTMLARRPPRRHNASCNPSASVVKRSPQHDLQLVGDARVATAARRAADPFSSALGYELFGPFQKGRGGPGGWWIIDEPELHFIQDSEVDVPDLAGWRRRRLPRIPQDHRFTVVPDWVCEVLSPSTESKDREVKMPIYAQFAVAYAWLIDPRAHTLEAYALEGGAWREIGRCAGGAPVAVAPFDAVTIDLGDLWAPTD